MPTDRPTLPARLDPAQVAAIVEAAYALPAPRRPFLGRLADGVRAIFGGSGWMAPGEPLPTVVPGRAQPRGWDFPVTINRVIQPRATEGISFAELRALADRATLVRLAIETCKDIDERFSWEVAPKAIPGRNVKDNDARIAEVQAFLQQPDRRLTFTRWMRTLREEQLCLDAPAVYLRRTRGGELFAFEPIAGDTLKPLVDVTGRRPLAGPAYEQVVKGMKVAEFSNEELHYMPRNPRAHRLYGYPPTEQLLIVGAAVINRELSQLLYNADGNIPDVFLKAPKEWTTDQIKAAQIWWDQRKGDLSARRGVTIVPEAGVQEMHEPPLKTEIDEWWAREVCWAFSLSPLVFLKQGMNRATGQVMADSALDEGLIPRQLFWSEFLEALIRLAWGWDDLTVTWQQARDPDPDIQSQIEVRDVQNGLRTINEIREAKGLDGVEGGDEPFFLTAGGPVLLRSIVGANEDGEAGEGVPAVEGEAAALPGGAAVQDTALNGAQITSLLEVVRAVNAGELDVEAAKALLVVAFPTIDDAEASRIMAGAEQRAAEAATRRDEAAAAIAAGQASNGDRPGGAPPAEGDRAATDMDPETATESDDKGTTPRDLRKRATRTVQTIPKRQKNFWQAERGTAPPRARPSGAWRGP